MKTTCYPPTEKERAFAASVAKTMCDQLQQAEVFPRDIADVATRLATELGKLLTTETTTDYEQLLPAAVQDYLFPPQDSDFEHLSERD